MVCRRQEVQGPRCKEGKKEMCYNTREERCGLVVREVMEEVREKRCRTQISRVFQCGGDEEAGVHFGH